MTVTRDQLLEPAKRRYDYVSLPIKGLKVRIQSLNERERGEYEAFFQTKKGDLNVNRLKYAKCHLAVQCIVDDDGSRMLSDDDAKALLGWDSADVGALWSGIREHCRFDEGDLEELVGNSEATTGSDSPTS